MAALLLIKQHIMKGVGGEWKCWITPCQIRELRLWPWWVMTHCATCLYTRSLLKKTLPTDLSVDLRKTKRLHYWISSVSYSSSWVNHPFFTLILFGNADAWQSFVELWIQQLESGGSKWADLSCNWTWWAPLNKARAHGRITANHNKLSQPSFCGLVMNLPLFMHACWHQAKLLCEDDQDWGQACWWEALLPHSTTAVQHSTLFFKEAQERKWSRQ